MYGQNKVHGFGFLDLFNEWVSIQEREEKQVGAPGQSFGFRRKVLISSDNLQDVTGGLSLPSGSLWTKGKSLRNPIGGLPPGNARIGSHNNSNLALF